jgi:hypothetical protein
MTTTVTKTMATMTTRLLLYVAQKGCFKIFKYEKQKETLEFFFSYALLIHSRFHSHRITVVHFSLA